MNSYVTHSNSYSKLISAIGTPVQQKNAQWLKPGLAAVCILAMLSAGSAFAQVENTEASYVGTATGNWSGGGAGVVGVPDGSCSNMGAQGKANFISNFGFTVPDSATITSITAFTRRGTANDETVVFQLASDVSVPTFIGTPEQIDIMGAGGGSCASAVQGMYPATSDNNLAEWGLVSLAPAVVNSANFGIGLTTDSQGTVKFDSVCLEIDYTTAEGPAVTEQCLTAPPSGANLQVVKSVVGTPPGTDWEFNVTGPGVNQNFTLAAAGASEPFASLTAGEYTITETTKAGYSVSAVCSVNEAPLADSNPADNIVTIDIADDETVNCSFVNTLNTATFIVNKDFSDNDDSVVTINLVCDSGTVTENDLDASELVSAEFELTGVTGTPNCTATESNVPPGYTSDNSLCTDVPLGSGSCTITNTLNTAQFTVTKDYSDDNTTPVEITLTCDGTTQIEDNTLDAYFGQDAVFNVSGFGESDTCTATEAATTGYTQDISGCQAENLLANGGSCTIVNTANVGTFTVRKRYTNASTAAVDVTLTCDAPAVVLNNPQPASPTTSAVFNVSRITEGVTTCSASEAVPPGFEADETDCNDGDLINGGCEIVNTPLPGTARFRVEKEFMDGNDITPASFRIDCNTGLILDQTKTADIIPGLSGDPSTFEVEFVVTDFTQGTMTCTVLEDPVPTGYTPSYDCDSNTLAVCDTGDPSDLDDYFEGPCVYNNVDTTQRFDEEESWEHLCVIRNYPNPVPVVINKTWEFAGSETLGIDPHYKLTLTCENEIITEGAVDEGYGNWSITFYNESGTADTQYSAMVIPDWDGGTSCEVYESQFDGAVEVDNGCGYLVANLADGDECTITNTVFYEGIPTLNQYGMALLALLMLGVGLVGFRRFA